VLEPAATPNSVPVEFIVATAVELLDHVPPVTVSLNCSLWPAYMVLDPLIADAVLFTVTVRLLLVSLKAELHPGCYRNNAPVDTAIRW